MSISIDARGRSCPEPVIMTKQAVESNPGQEIEVLVDANVAVENITRFAENSGYSVSVKEDGEDFVLKLNK